MFRKFGFAALLSATVLHAPMMVSTALADDKLSLILDWYVNPDHGPIIVADKLGYFEENGLEVEIIAPADASTPSRQVAAGQADLAVSYQQQLHLDVHEGLPLIRVGTLIDTPLNCLAVRDDGSVDDVTDLKDKKVGFSVAGVEEAVMSTILSHHGMTKDDVEMINVNFSLSPALMSKQVDAVIGAFRNVELNQMDIEGVKGKCFFVEEQGVPAYDELIYVAKADTFDTEKISRFLAATEKAANYIINHPEQAYEIYISYSPELKDELNKRAWKDTYPRFARTPAAFDHGRYQRQEAFLFEHKLVPEIFSVETFAVDVNAQRKD